MDNPEKLTTLGTQDSRRRQNKNKIHNIIYVGHYYGRKQTQITQIRHEFFYKQLEVKTNRKSFLCGNRNGHHNTELRT